jgi:energy-coupling factor transporter ATP-binding protein EcfA2
VTLKIHSGESVAIVSPSGGGKTTLLSVILGIHPPTEGTCELLPPPQAAIPSARITSIAMPTSAGRKRNDSDLGRASNIVPTKPTRPSSTHRRFPPKGGNERENGTTDDGAAVVTVTLMLVAPAEVTELDERPQAASEGAPLQASEIAWSRPSSGVSVTV